MASTGTGQRESQRASSGREDLVAAYKRLLQTYIDRRPKHEAEQLDSEGSEDRGRNPGSARQQTLHQGARDVVGRLRGAFSSFFAATLAHEFFTRASNSCGVTRLYTLSSIMTEGEQAQLPRQ